ncbi:cingulin [Cryptotermes secundus]|uniref:cingulin n=1 Tax=Cryptotermes secundus TaxID=105785 RepID=UPI000CD7AE1A|nr:cingulin [Cryptotermes secundus]
MAQDRGSPILCTGKCMAGEIEALKRERDAQQREIDELRDQCRDTWALKSHADKVTEERDALIVEAELNAQIARNLKRERDALRHETEELKAQCEHIGELKDQLHILMQKCRKMTDERDAWISKAQSMEANGDVLKRERNALKLETRKLRAQGEKAALLEEELKDVKVQLAFIAKERDSFQQRYRRSEKDSKSMNKIIEGLKLEAEELRKKNESNALLEKQLTAARRQCDAATKERNAFILKAQQVTQTKGTLQMKIDALKVEVEDLRSKNNERQLQQDELSALRRLCDDMERDRDFYKLEARRAAKTRVAQTKVIDALKLKVEDLHVQCKKSSLLEEQLSVAEQQWDKMRKERNAFILRAQKAERSRANIQMERDALKLEVKNLRSKINDVHENVTKRYK